MCDSRVGLIVTAFGLLGGCADSGVSNQGSGETGTTDSTPGTTTTGSDTGSSSSAGSSTQTGGQPTVPFDVPPREWTWIDDIDGAICRDGSPAGIGVNIDPASSDLVLFLGGGECSDANSCLLTKTSYGPAQLDSYTEHENPLVDRDNPLNPFKNWNLVFIPSCTGDLNVGDHRDTVVPGIADVQQFVGRPNMLAFVERVAQELPAVERVLLAGCSAGAFGARMSFELVHEAFPQAVVTTVMDSGPALPNPYYPSTLQQRQRELWNLDATVLADCGPACDDPNDFAEDIFDHLLEVYPDNVFAVIAYESDNLLSSFWSVDEVQYAEGLLAHRDRMVAAHANVGFYIIPKTDHCAGQQTTVENVDGVALIDWVAAAVDGSVTQVGP